MTHRSKGCGADGRGDRPPGGAGASRRGPGYALSAATRSQWPWVWITSASCLTNERRSRTCDDCRSWNCGSPLTPLPQGIIPEFVNPKYADESKTTFKSPTRLECMMQDYAKLLGSGAKVLGCRAGVHSKRGGRTHRPRTPGTEWVLRTSPPPPAPGGASNRRMLRGRTKLYLMFCLLSDILMFFVYFRSFI